MCKNKDKETEGIQLNNDAIRLTTDILIYMLIQDIKEATQKLQGLTRPKIIHLKLSIKQK